MVELVKPSVSRRCRSLRPAPARRRRPAAVGRSAAGRQPSRRGPSQPSLPIHTDPHTTARALQHTRRLRLQIARSMVIDSKTGQSKLDPIRTSYGGAIGCAPATHLTLPTPARRPSRPRCLQPAAAAQLRRLC
jgi:hypothetical protein